MGRLTTRTLSSSFKMNNEFETTDLSKAIDEVIEKQDQKARVSNKDAYAINAWSDLSLTDEIMGRSNTAKGVLTRAFVALAAAGGIYTAFNIFIDSVFPESPINPRNSVTSARIPALTATNALEQLGLILNPTPFATNAPNHTLTPTETPTSNLTATLPNIPTPPVK